MKNFADSESKNLRLDELDSIGWRDVILHLRPDFTEEKVEEVLVGMRRGWAEHERVSRLH